MKQSIGEQLSALLDSELPIEEEELLLRRLESDSEHRRTLGRYALIGDLIRGTSVNIGTLSLGDRVSQAVATEQVHKGRKVSAGKMHGLGKGLMGTAIAASVAILALASLGVFQSTKQAAPVIASAESGQPIAAAAAVSYTVPPGSPHSNVIAAARLTNYLVSHSEYSNSMSRQIMTSYIVNKVPESGGAVGADDPTGPSSFE